MKRFLTLAICAMTRQASASEVETRALPDDTDALPEHLRRLTFSCDRLGYFRDGAKAMERIETVNAKVDGLTKVPAGRDVQHMAFAAGKPIASFVVRGADVELVALTSRNPIHMRQHRTNESDATVVYFHISIPELGYYEHFEFKSGDLSPLLEGAEYSRVKESHRSSAMSAITAE